jgi:uncharacterized protein (TIGR03382 family)
MKTVIMTLSTLAVAGSAHAAVVTQWTFETQNTAPSTGTGSASLVGGTTATFATGFGGTGTFAWNTSTYAAQGTGDRTRGVEFLASTAGYENITLTWNERHSNTSANTVAVQVTTDGTNWTEVQVFTFTPAATGTGDTWYQRSVSLSAAVANSAGFGFRVLAAFDPTAGQYLASRSTSSYGTASTIRFDDVTISGDAIVPAPGAMALLGVAGLVGSRRRR